MESSPNVNREEDTAVGHSTLDSRAINRDTFDNRLGLGRDAMEIADELEIGCSEEDPSGLDLKR